MSSQGENQIKASVRSIDDLLHREKYFIDYFQREYRWENKQIKELINDLTGRFLKDYSPKHFPPEVKNYQNYYLGSIIVNDESDKNSIIDGQQRLTSLTLLLIYLSNRQKTKVDGSRTVKIDPLILSEKYGEKSFNIFDDMRVKCLEALYNKGEYEPEGGEYETVKNMVVRYKDIKKIMDHKIDDTALPYFIDWLIGNVTIVAIVTYSNDNAYMTFEAMNDRGLKLTSTERLKGFILSKVGGEKRGKANQIWKEQMQMIQDSLASRNYTPDDFFKAWFRAKCAKTMRGKIAGAEDKDFELIGSMFHSWFKDNHRKQFDIENPEEFYNFVSNDLKFFIKWYINIVAGWEKDIDFCNDMPHVYYLEDEGSGIVPSLQHPFLLSSINPEDTDQEIKKKLDLVAHFIERFSMMRRINHRRIASAFIKEYIFNTLKKMRAKKCEEIRTILNKEISNMGMNWDDGAYDFVLNTINGRLIRYFLARISGYIDSLVENTKKDGYGEYISFTGKRRRNYEIEHIVGSNYDIYGKEYENEMQFRRWRNSIGALILLPRGKNQSLGKMSYEEKLEHYAKENNYARTLSESNYENNPNFLKNPTVQKLKFKPHSEFKEKDIGERIELVARICKQIWPEKL